MKGLTVTLDMPPPRLVAEVMSPGKANRERDLIHKQAQYAAVGIPEYWLLDPQTKIVTVLALAGDDYADSQSPWKSFMAYKVRSRELVGQST